MIITFCEHKNFQKTKEHEEKILDFLENTVGEQSADMYLGGYGNFDEFAYSCCKKYKETHPSLSLIFVTPYITEEYQQNHLNYQKTRYDGIIYPEIENKPLRFAITYRNRYMVEKSDYVIAYVDHKWGGAYTTYKHALKKEKSVFNIGRI